MILGVNTKARFKVSDGRGVSLFTEITAGLVVAFDRGDYSKYIIYAEYREPGFLANHYTCVLSSNGLSIGAYNTGGTQVINGGSSLENVVQVVFY